MNYRDHYDWVVLGDHPGALLSGGLAARLGLSVLIVPMGETAKLSISKSGQHHDPEPNFVMGLGSLGGTPGLVAECIARLEVQDSEAGLIRNIPTTLPQILTPGARLGLSQDDDALASDLTRELGPELVKKMGIATALQQSETLYHSYWRELPERLTFNAAADPAQAESQRKKTLRLARGLDRVKRRPAKVGKLRPRGEPSWFYSHKTSADLARALESPSLDEICSGLWYSVTSHPKESPVLQDLLQVVALGRAGASFLGGMSAYREFLLRLARRQGAHIPEKAECRRIFVQNGRLVGVQLSNHGNMIGVNGGALGCSLDQAKEKVDFGGRNWRHRLKTPPTPTGWRFTLALTVHAEAIPPGMNQRVVWQEKGAPSLEIEVAEPGDFAAKNTSQRILFARTVLPYSQETLDPSYQKLVAARMLKQLTELIPFLEFHITRFCPDFREENQEGGFSELYAFKDLKMIPENLRCYSGQGTGAASGIEGLFLASGEALPELGSLGPAVAAVESVAWLAHRSGLAGPFV